MVPRRIEGPVETYTEKDVEKLNSVNGQQSFAAAEDKKETAETTMDNVNAVREAVAKKPVRKVRVEKKDKGLIEPQYESQVVLTEDNKMLLND